MSKLIERITAGRPPVGSSPASVVHRENEWRLLRYHSECIQYDTPILLVPSLINRHYVLDLLPGRSFVEYLVAQGHDVYIIDWGTPGPEDRYVTFDDVCDKYLGRAVRKAARTSGATSVHLLGYCLGGTLTTLYTAARPEHVRSMVAMAAPIRFHDSGMLSAWMRNPNVDIGAITEAFGNMPWPMMQASFHLLKPTLNLAKAVRLIDRAWDDEFLDGFFAIETWGNDNVSFPGAAYRQYVEQLYREDRLFNGTMRLCGRPARLEQIECPVLAVTFADDHIVPPESASILIDRVASVDKTHIAMPGGHVGAVVSKKAAARLWPQLSRWWVERSVSTVNRRSGPTTAVA